VAVLSALYSPPAVAASEEDPAVARLPGPANLVVQVSGRDLRVSWTAVSGAERYRLLWKPWDADEAKASRLTTAQTVATIPNLSPGTYLVSVGACQGKPFICTRGSDRTQRRVKVPDDQTLARLTRTFVNGATSVEAFVSGLPKHHKHRATFMVDSQALDQDFVSDAHPRVISWGATADTIFAWGTNADSPRYKEVEFIAKEAGNWAFGVIDFAATPPTVKRDETCQSCHIGDPPHPLWAQYPTWPGSLVAQYGGQATQKVEAWHKTGDRRLTAIPAWPDDFHHDRMAFEFNEALAIRHGEVLIESKMPDKPAARVRYAQKLLCENTKKNKDARLKWRTNIQARFPVRQMPKSMGEFASGMRNVDPEKGLKGDYLSSRGATVLTTIALYLAHYLVEHEERARAVYDRAENTESATWSWFLHHAPGTATALDELQSRVQIAFGLKDGPQLRYRRSTQAYRFRDMTLIDGHLEYLIPKVCAALSAE